MEGNEFLSQALRDLSPSELGELINAHDMIFDYVIGVMEEEGLNPTSDMTQDEFDEFVCDNDNVYQDVIDMFEEGLGEEGEFNDVKSVEEAKKRLIELSE